MFKPPLEICGVPYLIHLKFESPAIEAAVLKQNARALRSGFFSEEKLWQGQYYRAEILNGFCPGLYVEKVNSSIGWGVFAGQAIEKHSFVIEYTGLMRKRNRRLIAGNNYLLRYPNAEPGAEKFTVDAEKEGNYSRFINHSFEPNIEIASVFLDGMVHILLLTLKKIEKGEQLCCNYGEDYWKGIAPLSL